MHGTDHRRHQPYGAGAQLDDGDLPQMPLSLQQSEGHGSRDRDREHQAEGGTTIRPDLLPEIEPQPVPVKKGGVVFMHRWTPHRSTPNFSDGVRWSIDLRYQKTGTPTGRPFHPEFIARSHAHPEQELTDYAEWSRRWVEALENSRGIQAHRVK